MVLDGMAKRVLPLGNLRTCHADGSRHGRKKPEEKPLTIFVYCRLRILEDACKFLALGATCVNIRDGLFVPQGEDRIDACRPPRRDVTRDQGLDFVLNVVFPIAGEERKAELWRHNTHDLPWLAVNIKLLP